MRHGGRAPGVLWLPLANATELLGNIAYRRMIARRSDQSKEQATASSGVDRRSYDRLVGLICSIHGQAAMPVTMAVQAMASRTNWGSGYLLMASCRRNHFSVDRKNVAPVNGVECSESSGGRTHL